MPVMRSLLLAVALAAGCSGDPEPVDGGQPDAAIDDGGSPDAATTACGDISCDPTIHICVVRGPIGPGYSYTCEAIPPGCESDRTCDCTASTYCVDAFDTCTENVADNTITCECPACQ